MIFESYQKVEIRISDAIDALHEDWYINCAQTAKTFQMSVRRLQRRWNEFNSKSSRLSINKALSNEQEMTIHQYIEQLDKINMCVRSRMIIDAANHLLRSKNRVVDHQWFKRFLTRNLEYHRRRQKSLTMNRKNSHSVQNIKTYFYKFDEIMKSKRITSENVWNMNEIDFRIDCERTQMIITLNVNKSLRMTDSDNRDYITSMKCISSTEHVISLLIIISKIHILHKWCEHNDLDDDILIEISESDYSNDDLAMNWLNHFIEHTRNKRREAWIILIIDEFESHMTISFLNKIIDNNIVLFRLSAHSTHLTQSLNVEVFQSFKHYHIEIIDKAIRLSDTQFNKLEFLTAFQIFRDQIFKKSTIRHVFKITDLVSFNSNMMLNIIREKIRRDLRTFSSFFLSLFDRIFRSSESIVKYNKELQCAFAQIKSDDESTVNKTIMKRFIRDFIVSTHFMTLVTRDLLFIQMIISSRSKRISLTSTIAAKREVIKISECRDLCSKRKTKKNEKAKRKKKREKKKTQKSQNFMFNQIDYLLRVDELNE